MALTDIVHFPTTWSMYEARGNGGTLVDIEDLCPNTQCSKDVELARGNVGTLVDQVTPQRKVVEFPGFSGGATNFAF